MFAIYIALDNGDVVASPFYSADRYSTGQEAQEAADRMGREDYPDELVNPLTVVEVVR